ncbi:MAG: peptidylprolyl isomerase [Limnochordia bacterium]|jgi:foldase protein PrsA
MNSIFAMVLNLTSQRKGLVLFLMTGLVLGLLAGHNLPGRARAAADDVVLFINGEPITKDEFYGRLEQEGGQEILQQMIMEKVVYQAAEAAGITPDPEQLEEEFQTFKAGYFLDEQHFQMTLAQYGITEDQLRREMKLMSILEELAAKDVIITEADIEAYFAENKTRFDQPEQVRASHILVDDEALAAEILAQLQEGADFAQLAAEHSIDPGSKERGGDLGFFTEDRMVPEFSAAAFALDVGELSEVVQSTYGYHIILVTDRQEAVEATLESSKDQIQQLLRQERARDVNEVFQELRTGAKIEVKWEQYAPLGQ